MIAFFEKWYVLFTLLRIARHNKFRMKFEKKYETYLRIYSAMEKEGRDEE